MPESSGKVIQSKTVLLVLWSELNQRLLVVQGCAAQRAYVCSGPPTPVPTTCILQPGVGPPDSIVARALIKLHSMQFEGSIQSPHRTLPQ